VMMLVVGGSVGRGRVQDGLARQEQGLEDTCFIANSRAALRLLPATSETDAACGSIMVKNFANNKAIHGRKGFAQQLFHILNLLFSLLGHHQLDVSSSLTIIVIVMVFCGRTALPCF
jgi:hypothetical protein